MAGESQPAYLVYTTGGGFPPISEGIPQALKGIGTVFMMALLTGNGVNINRMRSPSLTTF